MHQTVSLGRIVHFVDFDSSLRAAIVTAVHDEITVNLTVFTSGGAIMPQTSVTWSRDLVPGTWRWPEYVPAKMSEPHPDSTPENPNPDTPAGEPGPEPEPVTEAPARAE